jgi:hypothetical protein
MFIADERYGTAIANTRSKLWKLKLNIEQEGVFIIMGTGTTTQTEPRLLTGLFRDRESTEGAYQSLRDRGYSQDEINVMMSDETRNKYYVDNSSTELGSKAAEGAGTGGAIGGTLGAIIGGVAAIGTNLLLPGLGLVVAGPLVAALVGAGAGGFTGGLVGALIGWGIPEARANVYEKGIKEGGTVLAVNPRNDDDADYFTNEWRGKYRGEEVYR